MGLGYVGSRFTGNEAAPKLSGYVLVDARVDVDVTQYFTLFLRTENLTNSSIFVFEKYRERDVYAALGLQWKF